MLSFQYSVDGDTRTGNSADAGTSIAFLKYSFPVSSRSLWPEELSCSAPPFDYRETIVERREKFLFSTFERQTISFFREIQWVPKNSESYELLDNEKNFD